MSRADPEDRPAGDTLDLPEQKPSDTASAAPEFEASVTYPEQTQSGFGAFLVAMERSTSPLPSKDWLDAVEEHYPGVTKILVDDYIAERAHSRELLRQAAGFDQTSFHRFAEYQRWQLAAATTVVLVIALGGIVLALNGKSLYGFSLLVFEVAGLVLAFLYGRTQSGDRRPSSEDGE